MMARKLPEHVSAVSPLGDALTDPTTNGRGRRNGRSAQIPTDPAALAAQAAAAQAAADVAATKQAIKGRNDAALTLAAGPYGPSQVTPAEILAPHPAPRVYHYVLITPEFAKALLERNQPTEAAPWPNRPIRHGDVTRWAAILQQGRWAYTHQGVALDVDGRLQDGQHRLTAIVDTGTAAPMMVSVGMPRTNFAVIDGGRRRTAGAVLAMQGVTTNTAATAAAVRLLILHERWGTSLLSHQFERVENDAVAAVQQRLDPDWLTWAISTAYKLRREGIKVAPGGVGAALYLIRSRCADGRPEAFADGLVRGVPPVDREPVYVLRRQLVRESGTAGRGRWQVAELMALVVKGWNLYATGGRADHIVIRGDSKMPKVLGGDVSDGEEDAP